MNILLLVIIIICFFVFLFVLYSLSNDDFVLLRKHVTTTSIFDTSFLLLLVSTLFARLLYVIFHLSPGFINPMVFFLFPYFPGLSLIGGIIGGIIFLQLSSVLRGFPKGRIFDVFSLSFLACLPLGFLLTSLHVFLLHLGMGIILLLLFIFLLRVFQKGKLKDGSISILVFLATSIVLLIGSNFEAHTKTLFLFSSDQILLFLLLLSSGAFFVHREKLISKKV